MKKQLENLGIYATHVLSKCNPSTLVHCPIQSHKTVPLNLKHKYDMSCSSLFSLVQGKKKRRHSGPALFSLDHFTLNKITNNNGIDSPVYENSPFIEWEIAKI
jgi:hypothetical protein